MHAVSSSGNVVPDSADGMRWLERGVAIVVIGLMGFALFSLAEAFHRRIDTGRIDA